MARNDPPRQRTEEEREAARREREARRAAKAKREGRPAPPPAEPPRAPVPPHGPQVTGPPDAPIAPAPPPAAPEPEMPAPPAPAPEPPPPMPAPDPEPPAPRPDPAPLAPDPAPPTLAPDSAPPQAEEAPLPTVRRARTPDDRPLPPKRRLPHSVGGGPPPGGDGQRPGASGSRRWRGRVVAGGVLALVLVAGWFLISLYQPFKGDAAGTRVRVEIPKDAGVGEIADILDEKGVVASAFFFQTRATLGGDRGKLKPGTYTLREDLSYSDAIAALSTGPPRNTVEVTVPEGQSRREVTDIADSAGLTGSYEQASKRSKLLDPADYGGDDAKNLEGFLFPSTYELKRKTKSRRLVDKQLQAFKREIAKVDFGNAKKRGFSRYEVLTIASMVERETALDKERPIVASVIYNRLERDEPLGIDATIRFATNNWEQPLTESELAIDSPYNTRKRQGLPPGPIGSPGQESIEAAANPKKTDLLFYVVKPCGEGEHAFSTTLEQFNKDVERYSTEREKQGKDPSDC